jgi:16S rRNA (cytidine1402-2'-O)-methyltransferase
MNNTLQPSSLYVIATPIGNLGDMSSRAIDILRSVNLILAEDTRSFARLASHYSIDTKVKSCFEHNEANRISELNERLAAGESLALVSEAGTPCISDPGYRITLACRDAGFEVLSVPGPCAAIAALSIAGFPSDKFLFLGFLPQKSGRRKSALMEALTTRATIVLYESPYRIVKVLSLLEELLPQSRIFIGREITKMHEESLIGTPEELRKELESRSKIRGEFVVLIHPDREFSQS